MKREDNADKKQEFDRVFLIIRKFFVTWFNLAIVDVNLWLFQSKGNYSNWSFPQNHLKILISSIRERNHVLLMLLFPILIWYERGTSLVNQFRTGCNWKNPGNCFNSFNFWAVIRVLSHFTNSFYDVQEGVPLYVYPQGLRDVLVYTKNKYGNPTIYITENGKNLIWW